MPAIARNLRGKQTDAERLLWRHIRGRQLDGHKFRRQHPVSGFVADFACPEAGLVIELDGGQHAANGRMDRQREQALECEGYRVLRFWNNQVLTETAEVPEEIRRQLAGGKKSDR